METTDLGSVLGIASGVSASLVMVCIAVGLTARFRQNQQHQRRRQRLASNGAHHRGADHERGAGASTATDAKANNGAAADEPDVILNNSGTRQSIRSTVNKVEWQLETHASLGRCALKATHSTKTSVFRQAEVAIRPGRIITRRPIR